MLDWRMLFWNMNKLKHLIWTIERKNRAVILRCCEGIGLSLIQNWVRFDFALSDSRVILTY